MKLSHALMRSARQLPPDFLELVDSATGGESASAGPDATYTVPLPTHKPGDLLVIFLHQNRTLGGTGSPSVTSGWTHQGNRRWDAEGIAGWVYTKIAESSSEVFTATFPVTNYIVRASVALAFRSQTGRVPKFEFLYTGQQDVGSSETSNYPEVIPSAGLQKYTWLLHCGAKRDNTSVPSLTMPSGYTRIQTAVYSSNTYGRLAVGLKSTHATSETPGAMPAIGSPTRRIKITAAVWEE